MKILEYYKNSIIEELEDEARENGWTLQEQAKETIKQATSNGAFILYYSDCLTRANQIIKDNDLIMSGYEVLDEVINSLDDDDINLLESYISKTNPIYSTSFNYHRAEWLEEFFICKIIQD